MIKRLNAQMAVGIDSCPFCGSLELDVISEPDEGAIRCSFCRAEIRAKTEDERFELIRDDIYRRIPKKFGLAIATEKWNRRAARLPSTARNVADMPSLFECSACGWGCSDTLTGDSEYKFCPNCGRILENGPPRAEEDKA